MLYVYHFFSLSFISNWINRNKHNWTIAKRLKMTYSSLKKVWEIKGYSYTVYITICKTSLQTAQLCHYIFKLSLESFEENSSLFHRKQIFHRSAAGLGYNGNIEYFLLVSSLFSKLISISLQCKRPLLPTTSDKKKQSIVKDVYLTFVLFRNSVFAWLT